MSTGPRSASTACSATSAAMSAAMPRRGLASSTTTTRPVSLGELRDRLGVERPGRAQVDHVHPHALGRERPRRLLGSPNHAAQQTTASAPSATIRASPKGIVQTPLGTRHARRRASCAREKDHRFPSGMASVGSPSASCGVDGINSFRPGMGIGGGQSAWLCRPAERARAEGGAQHHRVARLAAEHGGLVRHPVEAHTDEVDDHDSHHGPQPRGRRRRRATDEPALGDRRVEHPAAPVEAIQSSSLSAMQTPTATASCPA